MTCRSCLKVSDSGVPEFPAASTGFHSSVKLFPLSILATTLAHPPGGLEADLATKNTGDQLGLMAKLQYFGHLMRRANSLENILMLGKTEGRRRKRWQRMRWLNKITDSVDMSLSKLQEILEDRGAGCSAAAVHGATKSWTHLSD